MKTLRNFIGTLALVAGVLLLGSPSRAADLETIQLNRQLGQTVSRYVTTDGSIAMRLKWIGSGSAATVACSAAGDLVFTTDGTTPDTTIGLPTANGTIDVSDSSANTFGEIMDNINASPNWRGILVEVLPSQSCDNILVTFAETSTDGKPSVSTHGIFDEEGAELTVETANSDEISVSIGPEYTFDEYLSVSGDNLLNRRCTPTSSGSPTYRCELNYVTVSATLTTGAPDLKIYAVSSDAAGATELLLWQKAGSAVASSTSTATVDLTDLPPIKAPRGYRIVIKFVDSSTPDITAANIQAHGVFYAE